MADLDESHFDYDELFFSRTDERGIVLAGNSVFRRVSGYEWDELLYQPHNIVRHPDMPKGVFYLFWRTIQGGMPIGAYVKNKSKNGAHYWVFALAAPVPNGFLSVRLKPSSPIFEVVKKEYEGLLAQEKSKKMTPKDSCEALEAALVSLGFENYHEFMIKALIDELESRQAQLARDPLPALGQMRDVIDSCLRLRGISQEISNRFHESSYIPLNMTIQADRLGRDGDTLAVVAGKYEAMIAEMNDSFKEFAAAGDRVHATVSKCQYHICAAVIQNEVIAFFRNETDPGPIDANNEMNLLEQASRQGIKDSVSALIEVGTNFDRFRSACEQIQMLMTGLEIVRITGKIEISRIDNTHRTQLDTLIEDLFRFKTYLDQAIRNVSDLGARLQTVSGNIIQDLVHMNRSDVVN